MARCAVVGPDNIVKNIIVAVPGVDTPPKGTTLIASDTAATGWVWDGVSFVNPTPEEPEPVAVPPSITRRQCALELHARGIITITEALAMAKSADVPVAIAQVFDGAVANGFMTAEQRVLAEIDFAASNYYRANSLLGMMGLTEAEIDQFFITAAAL